MDLLTPSSLEVFPKRNRPGHTLRRNGPQHCHRSATVVTEEQGDQGTLREDIWSQKFGQHDSSTAGGTSRRRLMTELDGEKVVCDLCCTEVAQVM